MNIIQVFSLTPLGAPAVWGDIHTACVSVLRQLIVKLGGTNGQQVVAPSMEPVTAAQNTGTLILCPVPLGPAGLSFTQRKSGCFVRDGMTILM